MADDKDLEALTDLIGSHGFELFGAHVAREWGPSGMRFQQAVKDASQSQDAVLDLQKVIHTQEAIWALMSWPKERIEQLRAQRQPVHPMAALSRRGPGL